MSFEIRITHRAEKDIEKLSAKLKDKLHDILSEAIAINPYQGKKLLGDLEGCYSYRLDYQNRIVYRIKTKDKIVYILRARTHYGN